MKKEIKRVYKNKRCDECGILLRNEEAFLTKPSFISNKLWCLCKKCQEKIFGKNQ